MAIGTCSALDLGFYLVSETLQGGCGMITSAFGKVMMLEALRLGWLKVFGSGIP